MALQPVYEKLKNECFKKLAGGQTVVTAKIPAGEGAKIAKVLSVSADARVFGCESLSGEAKLSGRVEFKVLYVDAAGDNRCAVMGADFSDRLSSPAIMPELAPRPRCAVLDVDTVGVSGDEVRLSAVIETAVFAVASESLDYLKSGGDELYIQSETLKTQSVSASFEGEILLSEEFPCTKAAKRVVLASCEALELENRCGEGVVTAVGRAVVCAVVENDAGALEAVWRVLPFEQEIAADGVAMGDQAHADVRVERSDLQLNIEEDAATIMCEVSLAVSGSAFRGGEVEVITDAFSVAYETKTTAESVEITKTLFSRAFEAKIEGTASLETEMPSVDKVVTTLAPRINIANVYPDNDKIIVEGVLSAGVIYYNSELNNLNSVQVELPYSITLNAAGVTENSRLTAKGMPLSASARVRKINEVEVFAEVVFAVTVDETEIGYAVTSIECGAERIPSGSAIAIYITKKDESLWDAAKNLITTPELILAQNPTLRLPLEGGERILVYHQLRAKL